jgi:hypothetical protein
MIVIFGTGLVPVSSILIKQCQTVIIIVYRFFATNVSTYAGLYSGDDNYERRNFVEFKYSKYDIRSFLVSYTN